MKEELTEEQLEFLYYQEEQENLLRERLNAMYRMDEDGICDGFTIT